MIAVDGHASCGKSTLAKDLAGALGYIYIDSGAMYRAVTLHCLRKGLDVGNEQAIIAELSNINIGFERETCSGKFITLLNGENVERQIRNKQVSNGVSPVSAIAEVRRFLVEQQREYGRNKGITMDGRDIGTVVFPDAELKLFVTASIKVRTKRRYGELRAKGMEMTMDEVETNLLERDRLDSTRKESPLKQAEDAVLIDNSDITREQQLDLALDLAYERMRDV